MATKKYSKADLERLERHKQLAYWLGDRYEIDRQWFLNNAFFVEKNVPSKKNRKIWTGSRLISNKNTRKYEESVAWQYRLQAHLFAEKVRGRAKPIILAMYFIRDSARPFDYINICQVVMDMMVEYKYITDDNAREIVPLFLGYEIDKKKAGVYFLPV